MANNILLESASTFLLESGSFLQREDGTAGGPVAISDSDSATGTDALSALAFSGIGDVGFATDTAGNQTRGDSDPATGADSTSIAASLTASDTATSTDSGSLLASIAGADTASATDTAAVPSATLTDFDSATGAEALAALAAQLAAIDTALGVDAGTRALPATWRVFEAQGSAITEFEAVGAAAGSMEGG